MVALFFLLIFLFLYGIFGEKAENFRERWLRESAEGIFLVALGILIASLIEKKVNIEVIESFPHNYIIFALLGILIPTMRYGMYPLLFLLYSKGLSIGYLVSFLAADEMAEPPSIPLEIKYLGKKFFVYRLFLTIFIASLMGFIMDSLSFHFSINFSGKYAGTAGNFELLLIIPSAIGIGLLLEHALQKEVKSEPNTWFIASLLGIISPGPLVAYIPALGKLKKKVGIANIASFITGQTLCGPVRISIELFLFGPLFVLFRLLLALAMGIFAGFVTYVLRGTIGTTL